MKIVYFILCAVFLQSGCTPENDMEKARAFYERGNYPDAQTALEYFLYTHPYDISGLVLQCEIYSEQKQWNAAFLAYDSLVNAMSRHHPRLLEQLCMNFLLDGTKSINHKFRQEAFTALAEMKESSVIPMLLSALSDSSLAIRILSAGALAFFNERSAISSLVKFLSHSDPTTRIISAASLFAMSVENQTIPILQSAFRFSEYPLQESILKILESVRRPSVIPILLAAGKSESGNVRIHAAGHLLRLGHPEIAYAVVKSGLDQHDRIGDDAIKNALDILSKCRPLSSVSQLLEAAFDNEEDISFRLKAFAMRTMAKNGILNSNIDLSFFLDHKDEFIRRTAAETMYFINPDSGRYRLGLLQNDNINDIDFFLETGDAKLLEMLEKNMEAEPIHSKIRIAFSLAQLKKLDGIKYVLKFCRSNEPEISCAAAGGIVKILKIFDNA